MELANFRFLIIENVPFYSHNLQPHTPYTQQQRVYSKTKKTDCEASRLSNSFKKVYTEKYAEIKVSMFISC